MGMGDKIKETAQDLVGGTKETTGQAVGNERLQRQGQVEQEETEQERQEREAREAQQREDWEERGMYGEIHP